MNLMVETTRIIKNSLTQFLTVSLNRAADSVTNTEAEPVVSAGLGQSSHLGKTMASSPTTMPKL